MDNLAEDHKTPSTDHREDDKNIPENQNDNSTAEDFSDEEEFAPEEVEDELSQDSRFTGRGYQDPRLISSNNTQLQATSGKMQNTQSQSYNQNSVSQKKTQVPPRNFDPKRYDSRRG